MKTTSFITFSNPTPTSTHWYNNTETKSINKLNPKHIQTKTSKNDLVTPPFR